VIETAEKSGKRDRFREEGGGGCGCVLLLFDILRLGFRSRVLDRVTD
jgi:hypothetical protein